ncbi:SprT-like family-domain-containing protein [Linnemannia elongata]|nr:SprT-like family-domain-containing protein [Linnemannia elongata]
MEQSDEELARLLQSLEYEAATAQGSSSSTPIAISNDTDFAENNDSLALQTDAPFKDLHGLFLAFNDLYFESKLSACEVRWSPRMTVCAGLCVYQSAAHYCSIRLSEPLLKFRPESDYIDTLLHEMIHAYLFVTQAIQDHDGHGADFQHHMNRINKIAGTTITIYHTFHDEVRYYKTHVWKCNGPCQHRPPYYGIVKRSMNRPPQPADRWYAEHQESCGGTYTKISEPDPTPKKKSTKKTTKDASTEPEVKPKPKPRTMLDNFLIPQTKTVTTSSSSPSTSTSSSSTPSTPRTSSPSIPALEDHLKEIGLRNGVHVKSLLGKDGQDGRKQPSETLPGTNHHISPREAAAAAALARFERHLASNNQTSCPSTSPSSSSITAIPTTPTKPTARTTTTVQTKRKQLERTLSLDSDDDTDGWKKMKSDNKGNDEDDVIFVNATSPPPPPPHQKPSSGQDKSAVSMVACPVCTQQVEEATINDHVDLCIWRLSGGDA